jgi:hypothetical protein
MTESLDPDIPALVAALLDAAEKATPGPWFNDGVVLWVEGVEDTRYLECCGSPWPTGECCGNPLTAGEYGPTQEQFGQVGREEDADFIILACNSAKSFALAYQAERAVREAAEQLIHTRSMGVLGRSHFDDLKAAVRAAVEAAQ